MKTFPGLDTTDALTKAVVDELAAKAIRFVIKYCVDSGEYPDKRLTHAERALLVAAGIRSGFVFERGNSAEYFTAAQGKEDGNKVVDYFGELGVASLVGCFGAYDLDIEPSRVLDYAGNFREVIEPAGWLPGAYGSGAVLKALKDAGLIHFAWKANARLWSDFDGFTDWDILQATGSVAGLASDPDTAVNLNWAW